MAIKHNNQIPNNHFRKDWQRRVRVHFDQAGKKHSRRLARQSKAAAIAPRPVDRLRPIVRCPTIKYNRKVRAGRGFTLTELKAAGVPRLLAPTIGIAVDHRRQNLSEESLAANVARLKAYQARLLVFPKKGAKPAIPAGSAAATIAGVLPIVPVPAGVMEIKTSELPAQLEGGAFTTLRLARSNKKYAGVREKRIKDRAEAEANKK
ncbi:60S ribosomal protein l13 [Grosmannia clavigera kw1407]|uniref:60S ribosomal protein L13 n=1 Tax=Grosmannia clavigera (strain kw1407 / UAMH 11150) TaxID=655863 RepID=F0XJD4_GROCL|nr:60S ribosomal protein l13 [Grosmannia clavigera kw1407]EFX02428.1 60S ribosomal protein l13 [Grosmannia clavigera kw1407]